MSVQQRTNVLRNLDAVSFLRDHWQKKPLLIRGALPGFVSPLSPDELAGLACESDVESRLIEKNKDGWSLLHGPFDERMLSRLPRQDWTLLVQDVEKHLPELAEYLDLFDFIPRWRIDDLMISCAATGGGVGPHVDAYDVFLLQARGRRRWSIAENFEPSPIPDIDLHVLKNFTAEQEWILEPGDMLYLPPDVAHDGVALDDDCMTWSVGLRAPSLPDMFSDFTEWLYQRLPKEARYTDPALVDERTAAGRISSAALARMRAMLHDALTTGDAELDRWFGCFMTEPKPWLRCVPPAETPPNIESLRARLAADEYLLRDTRALLAWQTTGNSAILFANGAAYDLPATLTPLLEKLCGERRFVAGDFNGLPADGWTLLLQLHAAGVLHFPDEPGERE